ncbi:hypothetical protein J3A83DRAFT_2045765 [Scleroderma citrinum]
MRVRRFSACEYWIFSSLCFWNCVLHPWVLTVSRRIHPVSWTTQLSSFRNLDRVNSIYATSSATSDLVVTRTDVPMISSDLLPDPYCCSWIEHPPPLIRCYPLDFTRLLCFGSLFLMRFFSLTHSILHNRHENPTKTCKNHLTLQKHSTFYPFRPSTCRFSHCQFHPPVVGTLRLIITRRLVRHCLLDVTYIPLS